MRRGILPEDWAGDFAQALASGTVSPGFRSRSIRATLAATYRLGIATASVLYGGLSLPSVLELHAPCVSLLSRIRRTQSARFAPLSVTFSARQADKGLSDEWRIPSRPETRRWGKIREETYPIKLLADHKGYSDDATFRLKPFGFPAVDAELSAGHDQFALQITIADPIWASEDAKIQHGGYDNHLLMQALNRQGFVHGSGGFRRDGDKIVCDKPVKDGRDGADACRRGIVAALARKSKPRRSIP